MYRKVRLRLTLLFTMITCTLLLALLTVSFFLSANSQFSQQLVVFTRQSALTLEEAQQPNVLTTEWLNAREASGSFHIFILDQGMPAFHNSTHSLQAQQLFTELSAYFPETNEEVQLPGELRPVSENPNMFISYNGIFPRAFLCQDKMVKNNSLLHLYTIQPLTELYTALGRNLIFYLLLLLLASCFLAGFCWFFTGKLLQPLLDNQESQNRFISAASHELRTPLAVILASASACKSAPYEKQDSFFSVIEREGEQMSTMLDQLLTLSRADSHALVLQKADTDLQTLLLNSYEAFLPLAVKSGHHLSIELPDDDIPLCQCDSFRIGQVCNILLHNALSYTPPESHIFLFLTCHDKSVQISVQDNGEGIPDSEKEQIFDRFYRGAHFAGQKGHHGLGLAVAKEIAAAHNGTLAVRDAQGGGALFILSLPIAKTG